MPIFLFADADYSVPTNVIIWSICIGVNLGFIYNYYTKNLLGSIIRKLLAESSEENPKTLSELGVKRVTLWHKLILREGSYLRRLISVSGGALPKKKDAKGQDVYDWENARLYVSDHNRQKAKDAYGTAQKWIFLPIFLVLSVLVSAVMCILMPFFIEALPLL